MSVRIKGVDFSFSRPSIAALKAYGARFVVRYLSSKNDATMGKILVKAEAAKYTAAGLDVVSNYEWYTTRTTEGTDEQDHAAGVADAKTALAQHKAAGGPAGRPIFFSVDEDVPGSATIQYFKGVNSVLGVAATGVYGSYRVCKYLIDHGVIGKVRDGSAHWYAWQTYAWSGGQYDERCCLSQDHNGIKVGGADADLDYAHTTDFGQWGAATTNIEEGDMQLDDRVKLNGWIGEEFPDIAKAKGSLSVGTLLGSGYGHARHARYAIDQLVPQVAALSAAVKTLAELAGRGPGEGVRGDRGRSQKAAVVDALAEGAKAAQQ